MERERRGYKGRQDEKRIGSFHGGKDGRIERDKRRKKEGKAKEGKNVSNTRQVSLFGCQRLANWLGCHGERRVFPGFGPAPTGNPHSGNSWRRRSCRGAGGLARPANRFCYQSAPAPSLFVPSSSSFLPCSTSSFAPSFFHSSSFLYFFLSFLQRESFSLTSVSSNEITL